MNQSHENSEASTEHTNEAETSSTLTQPMETPPVQILMVGLDNSGKTTLHYALKFGDAQQHIPTIGYNVEVLEHKGKTFEIYEIGGLKTVRCLRNFYNNNKAFVIYVVDAADSERFDEAQHDLHDVMANENLKQAKLLVICNKIDLMEDFKRENLIEKLKLNEIKQNWQLHKCSAKNDKENLKKIFDLLETI